MDAVLRRWAWVAGSAALLAGCASPPPAPSAPANGSPRYDGPPLTLDSTGPMHIVRVESPSPGWSLNLDYVAEAPRARDVFISLRRPNPAYMYPQVIVAQHLSTGVETGKAIRLYARVVPWDTPLNDWSEPHRRVGE